MARKLDLKGQKFGKLTVVKFSHRNKYGQACWICKCDCGNTKIASTSSLRKGYNKSCGCLKKNSGRRREDLTGQKFGKLTVIAFEETRHGQLYYKCKCDCGKEKIINAYSLKRGITKSCGCFKQKNITKPNEGGIFYLHPCKVELKGDYQREQGGEIKEFKLSSAELAKYLEELQTKEVQYIGGIK